MTEDQIILSGWKEIGFACGIASKSTIIRIVKKYKMPIKRINGKPVISKIELLEWYSKLQV